MTSRFWPTLAAVGGFGMLNGVLSRRLANWGATPLEISQVLPGDDLIPGSRWRTTRALTVDAPPEAIWPWLIQMGTGRGGWYSIDTVVNLLNRVKTTSSKRIVANLQHITEGDVLDVTNEIYLTVAQVTPERSLVLSSSIRNQVGWPWAACWSWILVPLRGGQTRLMFRENINWHSSLMGYVATHADWVKFPLFWTNLRGLKQRAESNRSRL